MQQNVWTNLFKKLTSKGVIKMGISYIIIFICTCIAEIVLILGENATMGIAAWVAIGIALLGVAGGIWGQIIQLKKDAQRIENVNQIAILTAENQRLQEENQVLNEQLISLQAEIRKKPTITI